MSQTPKFSTVVRHAGRTIIAIANGEKRAASVQCNGCNACCRELTPIALDPEELENPRLRHDGANLLRQPDGSCTHLVGGKCEVYDARPRNCAVYDCRIDTLGSNVDPSVPDTHRAAYSRVAAPRDREDLELYYGLRIARGMMLKERLAAGENRQTALNHSIANAVSEAARDPALVRRLGCEHIDTALAALHAKRPGRTDAEWIQSMCKGVERRVFAPIRDGQISAAVAAMTQVSA